jgi:formylmethanofuran dehydrogenase subunit E
MLGKRSSRIAVTGTFNLNTMMINDHVVQWVDTEEFNLADLARIIGVDGEHKVKARMTLEVVEELCDICHEPTTGDKFCEKCGRPICDECSKTNSKGRYCPVCYDLLEQHTVL